MLCGQEKCEHTWIMAQQGASEHIVIAEAKLPSSAAIWSAVSPEPLQIKAHSGSASSNAFIAFRLPFLVA